MRPPASIGHFRILAQIGQGGMGVVYRAEDLKLGRQVAIKLLRPPEDASSAYSDAALRRFEREARAASGLNHPNILTVYEIGEADGASYIATEFVEGVTLRARMASGRLSLGEALDVAVQVAGALATAHAAGIVHRDIKPENIMLRPDGLVKVLDFGLAKLVEHEPPEPSATDAETGTVTIHETAPGHAVGTPRYMSPEQARGLILDARTDIFSLGVAIYEMAAGRRPFEGPTNSDTIAAILKEEPLPLDGPAELRRIVSKALEKNREHRYQSAKDLQADLKRWKHELEGGSTPAPVPAPPARARRLRAAASVAATVAAVAAAGTFLYVRSLPALGPKDMILLADFDNKTGDPLFDDTLKQALTAQIEQSRYLAVVPDVTVRAKLGYMSRPPDTRVTAAIGREICQRNGIKALVASSIAPLGSQYVLTLAAMDAANGADIARVQTEAGSKEQVLHALTGAATELRRKLGDSIASIRKFDAPSEATTNSLDALKAYTLGQKATRASRYPAAIQLFKHAVELDPDFAEAWRGLGVSASAIDRIDDALAASQKAYDLRGRVSELERLQIESSYYLVRGDRRREAEILDVAVQAYPRAYINWNNLAYDSKRLGQDEKSLSAYRHVLELTPDWSGARRELIDLLFIMNRPQEAEQACAEAASLHMEPGICRTTRLFSAVRSGDAAELQRQLDAIAAAPEGERLARQKTFAMFQGRFRDARELSRQMKCLECGQGFDTVLAVGEALAGRCDVVKEGFARGNLNHDEFGLSREAYAAAACRDTARTKEFVAELLKVSPNDTFKSDVYAPCLQSLAAGSRDPLTGEAAAYEVMRKDRMSPAGLFTLYCRGQVYLAQKKSAQAAAAFQTILDHPEWSPLDIVYAPAWAGVARAAAMSGDSARSGKAYGEFLRLWKTADTDSPLLIEAKRASGDEALAK
jgi:tetratricopeptide (TPR) repeat protein/tRNA A-37 threonylcarbamoyl transferase component Bud32